MMPNKLKVVLVSSGLKSEYGGSAVSEASLAEALETETDLKLLCGEGRLDPKFCDAFNLRNVKVFRPEEILQARFQSSHWLSKLIASADIVHLNGHWRMETYFFAQLCVALKIPYVLHPRGMLVMNQRRPRAKKIFNQLLGNFILRQAARVIALSRFEVRQFRLHPIKDSQIVVIPNGITVPPESQNSYPNLQPFFLYLGRIEERKNLIFLVEAFAKYLQQGGKANLHLVGPTERNYDQKLREVVRRLKIEEKVHLIEPAYGAEKWDIVRASLAVLYPTLEEVFGRVPFEALGAGKPAVVPEASGGAEYLRSQFPLGIYQNGSEESLVRCLMRLEQMDPRELAKEIQTAQSWVKSELNWRVVIKSVKRVYLDALRGGEPLSEIPEKKSVNK